jgi:hypothetical protein
MPESRQSYDAEEYDRVIPNSFRFYLNELVTQTKKQHRFPKEYGYETR